VTALTIGTHISFGKTGEIHPPCAKLHKNPFKTTGEHTNYLLSVGPHHRRINIFFFPYQNEPVWPVFPKTDAKTGTS